MKKKKEVEPVDLDESAEDSDKIEVVRVGTQDEIVEEDGSVKSQRIDSMTRQGSISPGPSVISISDLPELHSIGGSSSINTPNASSTRPPSPTNSKSSIQTSQLATHISDLKHQAEQAREKLNAIENYDKALNTLTWKDISALKTVDYM